MLPLALIGVVGATILFDVLRFHHLLARAVRRARPARARLAHYPSVSVVRPVRGRDVEAEANFRAALDTGYPGEVETLFIVDDASDPAYPLLRAAVEEHRRFRRHGRVSVLVAGSPPSGRTGKLNAMIVGLEAARGELVAFGDSDTRPDRDVLRAVVETLLQEPRAGAAFAPVVVAGSAATAGDVGYALLINGLYGPAVALASSQSNDLPFIMGQLMVMRREAIASIGGLACADGRLVDDMHIGACTARAGWRNVLSSHPLPIATGGMTLLEFLKLFRRWIMFSRSGLPRAFTWPQWLHGIEFWASAILVVAALLLHAPRVALIPGAALLTLAWSISSLHRRFGGARISVRHIWMTLGLFVLAPVIFVATRARRRVAWRGRAYRLDAEARLA